MMKKTSIAARILRVTGILLGTCILLLYIGLPAAMGVVTVLPAKGEVGQPPDGFNEVTLSTLDGLQLKAWYRPPANGAVILLLHGAGGSRESMRSYAAMLARGGYGVLALDQRGHGASQGETNRLGWQGNIDVGAAVTFLQAQPGVRAIGGLGSSMGGEALLGAAAAYPQVRAIVADGATRRCTAEYLALEANRPLVHNFTTRVMYATVQLLSGDPPPQPLLESMKAAQETRFLLIAAGNNELEIAFNRLFASTLNSRADLWVVPGAEHTGAFGLYPTEYEQRVLGFFQARLLE